MTHIGDDASHQTVTLPAGTTVTVSWAAVTDRGYQRQVNEDSVLAGPGIFAVADGMGGHTAGDFASSAVVERLSQLRTPPLNRHDFTAALYAAVADIASGVGQTEMGTGTTVTGLGFASDDGHDDLLVFNIGDSRVYRFANDELERVTVDHSIVQELIDAGSITPEQADVHPHANVITRAVGFNEVPPADYRSLALRAGDRFLVTSDGLTKELTDPGLGHFLRDSRTAADAADRLLNAALGNGGRDNVTLLVLDIEEVSVAGDESTDAAGDGKAGAAG